MGAKISRRQVLSVGAAGVAGWSVPLRACWPAGKQRSSNLQIGIGCIGMRYQGSVIAHKAAMFGRVVGVCDVDKDVRDQAKASFGSTPVAVEDYRDLLRRDDVDVVTIGAPDHWHTQS